MQSVLVVGIGGFFGAIARYALSGWMQRRISPATFPAGTLLVNVLGCLAIGGLMALVARRPEAGGTGLSETARNLWITGFLGSLTTFSTFGYETFALLEQRSFRIALWSVAANVLVGLCAVWLGWTAVRTFTSRQIG